MYSFPILHKLPEKYIIEYNRETVYSGRRFQSQLEDIDGGVYLTLETLMVSGSGA